jgi:hypothetical protein
MIIHESDESEDGDRFVQIESYQNIILAELAKNKLNENGIISETRDESMGSFYSQAVGGIRLMVKSSEFELAKKILDSNAFDETVEFKKEEEINSNDEYCSKCHSKNLTETKIGNTGILNKIINTAIGYEKIIRCLECGNEWKK